MLAALATLEPQGHTELLRSADQAARQYVRRGDTILLVSDLATSLMKDQG